MARGGMCEPGPTVASKESRFASKKLCMRGENIWGFSNWAGHLTAIDDIPVVEAFLRRLVR